MYTITHSCDLENQKECEIKIKPPKEMANFFNTAKFVRYLRYHIEYIEYNYEVVCPEYITKDGASTVVIPWFLIPGRPYPIQIYLFALDLYSTNPDIGQRAVAKATRDRFKLKKFAHTTVGRSFKALEQSRQKALESRFGNELKASSDETQIPSSEAENNADNTQKKQENRQFPSVLEIAARRRAMAEFLQKFHNSIKKVGFKAAVQLFVKYWYRKTKRLLL